MPNCDVCLVECRDGGVLACGHVVCRSCGMSQSKCLVCAEVGGKHRKRLGKRLIQSRVPSTPIRVDDLPRRDVPSDPNSDILPVKSPRLPDMQLRTARITELPTKSPRTSPPPPRLPISPAPTAILRRPSSQPQTSKTPSSTDDRDTTERPSKTSKKDPHPLPDPAATGLMAVHGPTAYDEVRCELRALGSAPRLARSALRTTGKLSVALLAKFVHTILHLSPSDRVVLRCSGEDLTDAMTLNHLVTHVWPESEGHMILDYRIAQTTGVAEPP